MVIASAVARMMPDKQKKSPELAAYTLAVEAHPRRTPCVSLNLRMLPRSGPHAAGREAIAPIMAAGPVLDGKVQLMPYQNLLPATVSVHHAEQPLSEVRSGLLPHITAEVAGAAESALKSGRVPMVQYRSVGGAVNDVAPDATAYAHRSQNFAVMSAAFPADVAALDAYWQQLGPYLDGVYVSFESRFDDRLLRAAFPGGTLQRLRALKAEYDPEQVFRDNFPIPPAL